jgi:DNA polymerase-4
MSRKQRLNGGADRSAPLADDTGCHILHIDMDAFYASVELLDHPQLAGTPVIIGGGERGVVLSATYEARALGVHSAMPISRARRLCPQATILPPHHTRYVAVSRAVRAIVDSVTPLVEPLALDEVFLDVSGATRLLGPPTTIGAMIRARVADEQGITCSVGIAPTKFVAKLATNRAKPDGMMVVPADGVVGFLHPLPVGALWGVGSRTEEQLHRLGLTTVGDLAHTPVRTLQRALGPALGAHLAALAWGRDERRVVPDEPDRSVGAESTFTHDVDDPTMVHRELLRLAEKVATRMRRRATVGRTVVLKVRFADFTTITRSRTIGSSTDVAQEIYTTARALYDALGLQRVRIRLVGVRVEQLVPREDQARQLSLGEPEHGWREAEAAVDRAAARFGPSAVRPARLLDPGQGGEPDAR